MTEIKIATIRGETAKRIAEVLNTSGIIIYKSGKESGRQVLHVFTEKKK